MRIRRYLFCVNNMAVCQYRVVANSFAIYMCWKAIAMRQRNIMYEYRGLLWERAKSTDSAKNWRANGAIKSLGRAQTSCRLSWTIKKKIYPSFYKMIYVVCSLKLEKLNGKRIYTYIFYENFILDGWYISAVNIFYTFNDNI